MKTHTKSRVHPSVHLVWSHDGALRRACPWPEVRFEQQVGRVWLEDDPGEDSLASAAIAMNPDAWREYLEFVPVAERVFLGRFRAGRVAALQVLARCPDMVTDLVATPVLATFLAAHRSLRGASLQCWAEIGAVYERDGIFGMMEWLGLPASPQTLVILQHFADPDLPIRLLEPLRARLWEPGTIWELQHTDEITCRHLQHCCHPLAA